MSDTRVDIQQKFFQRIDTTPTKDTDKIIGDYLRLLDEILEEDEEYNTIVNNNYVRKGEINDDSSRKTST